MRIKGLTTISQGANTGKNPSILMPQLIRGSILVPFNWTFPIAVTDSDATIVANLQTALTTLLTAGTGGTYITRGHFIGPYETYDDKMAAPTNQTLGYGKEVETDRGRYNDEFVFDEGGIDYFKSVLTFRNKTNQYKRLDIDLAGNLIATCTFDANGNVTGLQGFKMSRLYPFDWKNPNKTTEAEYRIAYSLSNSAERNENLFILETGIDLIGFVQDLGVQDVNIAAVGAMAAHVLDTVVTTADGAINLAVTLPGLCVAASFLCKNHNTGTTVGVTGVSIIAGKVRFTFDTASGGWSPGVNVDIYLTDVATLATAGFKYYESNVLSVAMVA